jgi:hypothetical protein
MSGTQTKEAFRAAARSGPWADEPKPAHPQLRPAFGKNSGARLA